MANGAPPAPEECRRIDKWLWCARQFRTRSQSARFVADQGVRVRRDDVDLRIDKAGFALKPGDLVALSLDRRVRILRVKAFADRRGGPDSARTLYEQVAEI